MNPMEDFGEFALLAPLLVLYRRLETAQIARDLQWVLPHTVLAGVTQAYGLPVVRADVPEPMLAYRLTALTESDAQPRSG